MAATTVPVDGTATILARARRGARGDAARGNAEKRLANLLAACPAVIYSFRATGDFAPTFVSDNLRDLLGYQPAEYLRNADFWRERRARARIVAVPSTGTVVAAIGPTSSPPPRIRVD